MFDGKIVYVDVFESKEIKVQYEGAAALLEKSENVKYEIEENTITVSGEKGYAVFVLK